MEHFAHATHLSSLLLVLLVAPAAILLWHFNVDRYSDVFTNGVEDTIIFLTPLALLTYQLVSMHVVYREGWSKTTSKCLLSFFLFNLLALATATGLIAWLAAKAMGRDLNFRFLRLYIRARQYVNKINILSTVRNSASCTDKETAA